MIICAAIKVTFERDGKQVEAIIPGLRHSDCWELMQTLGLPPRSQREEVEGFITHFGIFKDRYDAFDHAIMCGQLSYTIRSYKAEKGETELYSEDLY